MNKIIPAVWDLVRDGIAGMSNVLPLASLSREVQREVLEVFKKYVEDGIALTREKIKITIRDYKNGNVSTNNHGDENEKRERGKHLNMREKQQIIEKRNNGQKIKDIANDFNTSDTAVKRILRLYKNGEDLEPKIENRGRKPRKSLD
jgi:ArsR family metal-binding transcriptional regulator